MFVLNLSNKIFDNPSYTLTIRSIPSPPPIKYFPLMLPEVEIKRGVCVCLCDLLFLEYISASQYSAMDKETGECFIWAAYVMMTSEWFRHEMSSLMATAYDS